MYKRIARLVAVICARREEDQRRDLDDATRLFRYLTEYFEKEGRKR